MEPKPKMLPVDVLEAVFFHLDFCSLSTAKSVCSGWAEICRQDAVVTAAAANTRSKLTHRMIEHGLGLTRTEVRSLPGTAYITHRGHACSLYGPEAIVKGLKIRGGRRQLLKTRREEKKLPKRCYF